MHQITWIPSTCILFPEFQHKSFLRCTLVSYHFDERYVAFRWTLLSRYWLQRGVYTWYIPGIVRGCGLQKVGACVNLSAYYLVGIPAALCFAFVYHLGGMVLILPPIPCIQKVSVSPVFHSHLKKPLKTNLWVWTSGAVVRYNLWINRADAAAAGHHHADQLGQRGRQSKSNQNICHAYALFHWSASRCLEFL